MTRLAVASDELTEVRTAFEGWRRNRRHERERIPETLWGAAVELLDEYPVAVVARELRLNPQGLRERRLATQPGERLRFVECQPEAASPGLGGAAPAETEIRLSVARRDGSRLGLAVSSREWAGVERLWAAFVGGGA